MWGDAISIFIMCLLSHCSWPHPWPACSSGYSLFTGSFLRLEYLSSGSWRASSTLSGIGHWIKLPLPRCCPDCPSEVDLSLSSPTTCPVACFSPLVTMSMALLTLLLIGPPDQDLRQGRDQDFVVHHCVCSALHCAWPANEWMHESNPVYPLNLK